MFDARSPNDVAGIDVRVSVFAGAKAQRLQQSLGERVRFARAPVIAEAPDDEAVRPDERVLRGEHRVGRCVGAGRRRRSGRAAAPGRRHRAVCPPIERRLAGDHEVGARLHGAFEHVERRHGRGRHARDHGAGIARLETVDGFRLPLEPDVLLDAGDELLARERSSGRWPLRVTNGAATAPVAVSATNSRLEIGFIL